MILSRDTVCLLKRVYFGGVICIITGHNRIKRSLNFYRIEYIFFVKKSPSN